MGSTPTRTISFTEETMTLFDFLTEIGEYQSTSVVRRVMVTADIKINGTTVEMPFSQKLTPGDKITVGDKEYIYAG